MLHRIDRRFCLASLLLLTIGGAAYGEQIFFDDFPCEGRFEYRTIYSPAPERTDNWCIKITKLPDDRLLMGWCSTAGAELDPTNKVWLSYSKDEGKTWGEPILFAKTTDDGRVLGPCLYTHTNGRVFVFYDLIHDDRYDVVYQTSDNCGQTWSPRTKIECDEKYLGLMDNPIRLADGSIVLPVFYDRHSGGQERFVAAVLRSTDGGKSWWRGSQMDVPSPRGAMEPTIAELNDGQLYCLLRTKSGWLYEAWSKDRGATWTKPRQSAFPSPESTPMLRRLASGSLLLVWNNNDLSRGANVPRYPLSLAMSDDDGKTWPHQRMIQTSAGQRQLSNHGVFQTDRGDILVTTNHWAGKIEGKDHGNIELARFDEAWIRSRLSSEKWSQQASATGGIRLDKDGVLLAAGANNGDNTLLMAKVRLPARGQIEFELTDEERELQTYTGFFVGGVPFGDKPWFAIVRENNEGKSSLAVRSSDLGAKWVGLDARRYFESTKVTIELDEDRIRYSDSRGVKSEWQSLPKELPQPLTFGLFARNSGVPARLRMRSARVEETGSSPRRTRTSRESR